MKAPIIIIMSPSSRQFDFDFPLYTSVNFFHSVVVVESSSLLPSSTDSKRNTKPNNKPKKLDATR